MSESRFVPLGPIDSNPSSRAFLGYERGPQGPLWPVVLVWVPEEVEEDPDRMAQLREDTARAAQIDHANVIRVIGCERLDEGFARVVEYGDAESLQVFMSAAAAGGQSIPVQALLRVIADAAAGVHHVHELGQLEGNVRGRLHGALRPGTLLVGFDGSTKVTGYGALAVAPRDVFGASLSPRLQSLSPEELEGGPGAADRRSDVYGLSLILYEAVAGRLPYRIDEPDFEARVLSGQLPLEPLAQAPAMLREVIVKGLARKPADRFPSAAMLRQALESLGPWTPMQVAQFCATVMPESGADRSGRLQLLREVGFAPGPLPRPAMRAKPIAPAVARPLAPPPKSQPPAPPPPPVKVASAAAPPRLATPAPPPRAGLPLGLVILGGVGVALALACMLFFLRPDIWRALVSGTPVVPPEPSPLALARPLAPAVIPEVPPEPAPLPPPGPQPATLELSSDPPLQVSVDGKPHGTTPVALEVPAGDHRVRFRDPALGIDVERTVHAKEGGHQRVPLHLSRASMEVTAPDGAVVFLDGKLQGTAPVPALKFYEGHHTIKVKMGKAVFDRQFSAQAGEALTLNVQTTQQ